MLVYRDVYRSNKIYEYERLSGFSTDNHYHSAPKGAWNDEQLYVNFYIRKYSKEEMKEVKMRIEKDYHEIQHKYG